MVAKEGECILFASSFPRGELLTGHDTSGGATIYQFTTSSVLPSPRFSRGIGLVLDLFRGEKIAVAGCFFLGLLFMHMPLFLG